MTDPEETKPDTKPEPRPYRKWTLERFQEFCENFPESRYDLSLRELLGLFCLALAAAHLFVFLCAIATYFARMAGFNVDFNLNFD